MRDFNDVGCVKSVTKGHGAFFVHHTYLTISNEYRQNKFKTS